MYEYVEGKAMWANVSTPNTKFEPHKYGIVVLTDEDTASRLEGLGLSRVRTRDGNDMDVSVGNGSGVTVKFKPYTGKYGTFAELIAVKVTDLIEYSESSSDDNEEF